MTCLDSLPGCEAGSLRQVLRLIQTLQAHRLASPQKTRTWTKLCRSTSLASLAGLPPQPLAVRAGACGIAWVL